MNSAAGIAAVSFGNTAIEVSVIAQGGARMELHPNIQAAAAHVRMVSHHQDSQARGERGEPELENFAAHAEDRLC